MKKLALTSLLAVFAVSGAHAANVIDGNPLYMPKAGHFYSVSSLETETRNVDVLSIGEEFGYGITDRLTVNVNASVAEDDWFKAAEWQDMGFGLAFRVADYAHWKFDVIGGYSVNPVWSDGGHKFFHGRFLDKDDTQYTWTAGVRGGYTAGDITLAGHVEMDYDNIKSFNWNKNETSGHMLRAGLDAQLVLNNSWNLVSGAEYYKSLEHYNSTRGNWELSFGANYNIDTTKFVGAYVTKDVEHTRRREEGDWEFADGFGLGVKFGIDF